MGKRKIHRYLINRCKVYSIFWAVIVLGLVLFSDRLLPLSEPVWRLVFPLALVMAVLTGFFWIYRPYRRLNAQLQRFSDGFISLEDLNEEDVHLSPEMERLIRHISRFTESARTLDLTKRQAQYRALQNQINPHFLYNTLEGIRSEAIIGGMDNLADMTEALANFFRYTISKVENLVTVEEELDNCVTYFKIQQYRFGSRVHLEILKDEEDWDEILHCLIPKLTLQPILENSIIHGIELKLGEGRTTIEITRTHSRLLIRVSDDGVGMDRQTLYRLNARLNSKEEELKNNLQPEQGGVALPNVNNRIHLIFGDEYGMHVYSAENMGTRVELSIPVIFNEKDLKTIHGRELP